MELRDFIDLVCRHYGITKYRLGKSCGFRPTAMSSYCSAGVIGLPSARILSEFLGLELSDIPGTRKYSGREITESDLVKEINFEELELNPPKSVKKPLGNSPHIESFHEFKCPCCGLSVVFRISCEGKLSPEDCV